MKTLITAALLLALASPAHAEWFLILDAWTCSTRSCADPATVYKGFDRDSVYNDVVVKETFATRKQCLAKGRRVSKLFNDIYYSDKPTDDTVFDTEDGRTLSEAMEAHMNADGLRIGGFHSRCEWHR